MFINLLSYRDTSPLEKGELERLMNNLLYIIKIYYILKNLINLK